MGFKWEMQRVYSWTVQVSSVFINTWLEFGPFCPFVDTFFPSPLLPNFCEECIFFNSLLITQSLIQLHLSLALNLSTLHKQFSPDTERHLNISTDFFFLRARSLGPLMTFGSILFLQVFCSLGFCHTHCSLPISDQLFGYLSFSDYLVVHFPSIQFYPTWFQKRYSFLWCPVSSLPNIHKSFWYGFWSLTNLGSDSSSAANEHFDLRYFGQLLQIPLLHHENFDRLKMLLVMYCPI